MSMDYRRLGSTGTRVSELCFGTWRFGRESGGVAVVRRDLRRRVDRGLLLAHLGVLDDRLRFRVVGLLVRVVVAVGVLVSLRLRLAPRGRLRPDR